MTDRTVPELLSDAVPPEREPTEGVEPEDHEERDQAEEAEHERGVDVGAARTRDPRVLGVAEKVGYVLDPTLPYPQRFTGHVRVELHDGRVLEETQDAPRGGPERPLPPEELQAKFRANAGRALPAAQVDGLLAGLLALDTAADVAPILGGLRRAA